MDIEEDIKKLKELNNLLKFFRTHGWIPDLSRNINTNGTIEAIDHILAEREEDKKKIEELEKEIKKNKMYLIMASEVIDNSVLKPKVKDELEKAKSENEPYELHNKESRMYWLNQGKISLAKKILEDK